MEPRWKAHQSYSGNGLVTSLNLVPNKVCTLLSRLNNYELYT